MAIRSPINPQTIAKERQATMPAAMNFISGGSPLGSSIVSSAANKIVGFQRGASSVAPRTPDLGSIIKTLSSNILTNVENRVQSINQNVNNIINQSLKTFGQDYQDRIKQIDDAKPSGILANFLKLYQQAIGFIQFLGNRKNVKTLGDNLQVLQRIFTETFEVAKIIRQTIVKIVKQLSNLPTASTGGGGLNLDIKVPGGPLKRSAPKGAMNMLKMAGAGAAIAGAGALGTKAVSGMMDVGGEEVQAVPGSGSEGLSGPILDRFNAILERFDAAISSMTKKPATAPSAPAGGGGGSAAPETPDPGGGGGGAVVSSGTAGENIAAFTSTLEATGDQNVADVMQVMINRAAKNHSGYGDLFNQVTAREQFTPMSAAINIESADKNAQRVYGPIAAKLGKNPKERIAKLKEIAEGPNGLENLRALFGKGDPASANRVLNDFKTRGTLSQTSAKDVGGGLYFRGRNVNISGVYLDRGSNKFIGGKGSGPATLAQVSSGTSVTAPPAKPGVTSAPTPAATTQQIAQTVAQPAQQKPQVTVLPMAMNAGSTPPPPKPPSSGGSPAPNMTSGRMLPSLSSANHDNFLTLYSKMVYNIVDG